MAMPAINNKNGDLSAYGLGCGYTQSHNAHGVNVQLWQEHGVYHVRVHDFTTGKRMAWEVFNRLTPARKLYRNWCRFADTHTD